MNRVHAVWPLLFALVALSARAEPPAVHAAAAAAGASSYAGSADCGTCHEDLVPAFSKTAHGRVLTADRAHTPAMARGCEACHGPAAAHVESGGGPAEGMLRFEARSADSSKQDAACLACHSKGSRIHWPGSAHESRDVGCSDCHTVHESRSESHLLAKPTELETCGSCHLVQRTQMFRNAHMPVREGAMSCSSCHDTHGSVSEALLRHPTVNDGCYSCHAEKRGPFLWEHAPVTESCLNCHDAHGTPRESMLKVSQPRVCQQCHVASLHPSQPRSAGDRFVLSRSCGQCHVNIHGSNHPSGFGFTR